MKDHQDKKILREFGILIGLLFPLLIGLIIPFLNGHSFQYWTLFISLPFLILGLIKPYILIAPYKVWMSFGNLLGWFNSKLILGFIFTIVLQPIALFMKLFGYDPLNLTRNNKKTYFIDNRKTKIDLNKIF